MTSKYKNQIILFMSVALTALASGMFTNFVNASVPDSTGVISACYRTSGGDLRVRDTAIAADTCSNKETAISWSQTGPQGPAGVSGGDVAYARIIFDADNNLYSLDSAHAKNMSSFQKSPSDPNIYCATVDFSPNVLAVQPIGSGNTPVYAIKYANGWNSLSLNYFDECDSFPSANLAIASQGTDYFLEIH